MNRILIAVACLVSTLAFADVEIPTGSMNECGFRSIIASRIQETQAAGLEDDVIVAGFIQWMTDQMKTISTSRELSMSQEIIARWLIRVDADGFQQWIEGVLNTNYSDPVTAGSKERLKCWKELAGETK